jgi:hypothetical protein
VSYAPLATPVAVVIAAIIAAIFAWSQARTARNKLRMDLFDRRYFVYQATRDLLFSWSSNVSVPREDLSKFLRGITGVRWLYSAEFEAVLHNDIFRPIERLKRLEDPRWQGATEGGKVKESDQIQSNLDRQLKDLDKNFAPFLQLRH